MTQWQGNQAQLFESVDPPREDGAVSLDLERTRINSPEEAPTYTLRIFNGDDDTALRGLTGAQVCDLAEDLINLVGGRLRVEPPADPEIKF